MAHDSELPRCNLSQTVTPGGPHPSSVRDIIEWPPKASRVVFPPVDNWDRVTHPDDRLRRYSLYLGQSAESLIKPKNSSLSLYFSDQTR